MLGRPQSGFVVRLGLVASLVAHGDRWHGADHGASLWTNGEAQVSAADSRWQAGRRRSVMLSSGKRRGDTAGEETAG